MINRLYLGWTQTRLQEWTTQTLYGKGIIRQRVAPWYWFRGKLLIWEAGFRGRRLGWYDSKDKAIAAVSNAAIRVMNEYLRRNSP